MSLNKELKDIIEESESECECVYGEECYSMVYPDGKTAVVWGNYKRVREDGKVLLKVINFPVPESCEFVGESLWVEVMVGNNNEGIGRLDNEPNFCEEVKVNDIVNEGGTDERKPHFAGKYNIESSDDEEEE